jgi:hydroxymethylbilane synthase
MAAMAFLDDAATRFAVTAERAALAALGGGCQVPIGIHCRPKQDETGWDEIFGVVADPASGKAIRAYHCAPRTGSDPVEFGRAVVAKLISAGAGELVELREHGGVAH